MSFTQERALRSFSETVETLRSSGLGCIAAGAVCFINGTAKGLEAGEISASLQSVVEARGLKPASVYRYLGLAKALSTGLSDAAAKAIAEARSPHLAQEAIAAWFEQKKVVSLDSLAETLGTYKRTKAAESAAEPERAAAKPHDAAAERNISADIDPRVWAQQLAAELNDVDLCFSLGDIFFDRGEELEAAAKRNTRRENRPASEASASTHQ